MVHVETKTTFFETHNSPSFLVGEIIFGNLIDVPTTIWISTLLFGRSGHHHFPHGRIAGKPVFCKKEVENRVFHEDSVIYVRLTCI